MNTQKTLILLGSFNGELFIQEQLNSIISQTHTDWKIIVSDDGSQDATCALVQSVAESLGYGRMVLRQGPGKGFVQNFLSMACDPKLRAKFYAFADQDDVWLPQKLERALSILDCPELKETPALYCGRTTYVNTELKVTGQSPYFKKTPHFKNALVQSLAGGNTMVFNDPLKKILEHIGTVDVVSHDWWVYQLVTGVGGYVYYDEEPWILYRQHPNALIGGNTSVRAKVKRVRMVAEGVYAKMNLKSLAALRSANRYLTTESREVLKLFSLANQESWYKRLYALLKSGVYRQSPSGQLSLIIAAVLRKL